MNEIDEEKTNGLSAESVVKIMEKHGESVSIDQANDILKTIRTFVRIAVDQYLRDR